MTNFSRPATDAEIRNYRAVEDLMRDFDDDRYLRIAEAVGDYLCALDTTDKRRAYSRVYGYGKRLGVKVAVLVDWYCID